MEFPCSEQPLLTSPISPPVLGWPVYCRVLQWWEIQLGAWQPGASTSPVIPGCVTLAKSLNLSQSQSLHLRGPFFWCACIKGNVAKAVSPVPGLWYAFPPKSLFPFSSLLHQIVSTLLGQALFYLPVWPRGLNSAWLTVAAASSVLITLCWTICKTEALLRQDFPKVF